MEKSYSKMQLEDKALKKATMYFGQELLPYFKIGKKIRHMLPTEQIRLEAVRATEDILFEMEDGTLAHFEFESVEVNSDDLRRFRMYDAYTGQVYKKSVITYVICSGKVHKIQYKLADELNSYSVIPLQMKQEDADVLFLKLENKIEAGEEITKKDLAPLLLAPLMSGISSIKDRLLKVRQILNMDCCQLKKMEKMNMEGVLYAFASKFLKKEELNEIKEALSMTVLGEMIWNDGLEKGGDIRLINMISRKLRKGKTPEQIAEDLDEDLFIVERICKAADKSAPEYNSDEIYRILKNQVK